MPTYDYVCSACDHRFERFQRMSDGALRKCPECGRLRLKRLMGSGAGIIFKGSGFYETDYKRKSGSNGTSSYSSPPADSNSEAKNEKKTETKTADTKKSKED